MANIFEKRWPQVPAQSFTADGTSEGVITVADSTKFHVKQQILLKSNTQSPLLLQVNRIPNSTQIEIGPLGGTIHRRYDLSSFLIADSAVISAEEQVRPKIGQEDFSRAVYAEEPAVATRTLSVDQSGDTYTNSNPMPVTQSFDKFFDLITSSKWMDLGTYDRVVPVFSNSNKTMTASFFEDDGLLGDAVVNYNSVFDWDITLNRYINDDDGSVITDDDGSNLNLD